MRVTFIHAYLLLKRLILICIIFQITRFCFYIFNLNYFTSLTFSEAIKIFFWGTRFDLYSILFLNFLFVIFHIIPGNFKNNKKFQFFLKILFVITNSIMILANMADIEYFKFIDKRSTADVFKLITKGNDTINMLPQFIIDFWYYLLITIILIFILWKFYPKLNSDKLIKQKFKFTNLIYQLLFFIVSITVFTIIVRGVELRPCSIITATKYTTTHNVPLIVNTPFTILHTIDKKDIIQKKYYNESELKSIYNPVIKNNNNKGLKRSNVVIIILESISKEYISFFNKKKGLTPFIDSLLNNSLTFNYSFANGKKSMEAIPSIVASIPVFMDEPYITSQYSSTKINSLASILKTEGYNTSFFHGGINGTMGFDYFSKIAEYDNYFGKNEYNNDKDYDGNWGIYDEEFLQYYATKLNTFSKPFFSTIFTLSSHHPYKIPEKYNENRFKGNTKFEKSISYTDYSLSRFFNIIKKMPWYNNTLFIITADHTSMSNEPLYLTQYGTYSIPIIYYKPNDSTLKNVSDIITQQTDIMPSVLDYINYSKPFVAFGSSVFNTTSNHFAFQYINGIYQLFYEDYLLLYNGEISLVLYNYKSDAMLSTNLISTLPEVKEKLEKYLKAIIQNYNNRIINNKMTIQ